MGSVGSTCRTQNEAPPPFVLKAVSALLIQTDGGVTVLVTLIQLGESPWLQFPGSISVWNVDSHPQHLLWKLFSVIALGALEEVLC